MVEPDRAVAGGRVRRVRADLEQAEVVVVGAALGLQERGAGEAHDRPEPEHLGVEGDAALDVADVEDGVVESLHGHVGLLLSVVLGYP